MTAMHTLLQAQAAESGEESLELLLKALQNAEARPSTDPPSIEPARMHGALPAPAALRHACAEMLENVKTAVMSGVDCKQTD